MKCQGNKVKLSMLFFVSRTPKRTIKDKTILKNYKLIIIHAEVDIMSCIFVLCLFEQQKGFFNL